MGVTLPEAMAFENENTIFKMAQSGRTPELDQEFEAALAKLRSETGDTFPMLIDGKAVTSGQTFEDKNPANGETLARFQLGTKTHVDQAVDAAKRAFNEWSHTPWETRVEIFERAAVLMREQRPRLAALMTLENGKNRVEAYYDVDEAIDFLKFYAQDMRDHKGYTQTLGKPFPDERCVSKMRPCGTFAVIGPFNFPVAIPAGMTAAALITGNTAVVKPASDAPWTAYEVVKLFHDAGVPAGAVNYITGGGREVGQTLIDHPDTEGLVFTGSREVGMHNYAKFVGQRPRPYIAEMGGKNAIVVTQSADLDKAAEGVMKSAFGFSGQKCSAASRCYVHEDVKDAFVTKLVEQTQKLVVNLPWEKNADLGPLINQGAIHTYQKAVDAAKAAGGKILHGGNVLTKGDLAHGHFVEPTIVTDLPQGHEAFRTEYFVPFIAIATYDNFDEVLNEVNAVDYGLTSGIFTTEKVEIEKYFDRIQAGVVYSNRHRGGSSGAMVGGQSFGGWKYSATTSRGAGGPNYLPQFMREQSRTYVE